MVIIALERWGNLLPEYPLTSTVVNINRSLGIHDNRVIAFIGFKNSSIMASPQLVTEIDCKTKVLCSASAGTLTYVGLANNVIRAFNWSSGKLVRSFMGHNGPVTSVLLSKCGTYLYSGSWDKRIFRWNISTKTVDPNLYFYPAESISKTAHNDYVKCMCFSPDETVLFSGSADGALYKWNIPVQADTPQYLTPSVMRFHRRSLESICLLPPTATGDLLIATGSSDRVVAIINTRTMAPVFELSPHPTTVKGVYYVGGLLWTSCADNSVRAFELPESIFTQSSVAPDREPQEHEVLKYELDAEDWVTSWSFPSEELMFDKKGDIALGVRSKRVIVCSIEGGKLQKSREIKRFFDGVSSLERRYYSVGEPDTSDSPKKEMLVCGSWDFKLRRFFLDPADDPAATIEESSDIPLDSDDDKAEALADARLRSMLQADGAPSGLQNPEAK